MIGIKGMIMPPACQFCPMLHYYPLSGNVWCNAKNALMEENFSISTGELAIPRPEWCPLIDLTDDGK